jgi:Flp pilus assembly protein TadG
MKRSGKRHRGFAAVMMAASITVLFGVLGFVTDIGYAYFRKQAAQTAAEAAILAGTSYAAANGAVCGISGVVCQSTATTCSNISGTGSLVVACQYAAQNGYTDGTHNITVSLSSGTGSPPGSSGVTTSAYWIQATVTENLPQFFSAVFGNKTLQVNTAATAVASAGPAQGSIYVLGSGSGTVTTDGTLALGSASAIFVNSSSSSAVQLSNNDSIAVSGGQCLHVVGNCQKSGHATITPTPITGDSVHPDPYTKMQPPTDNGCDHWDDIDHNSGSHTLNPGTYCGHISITGSASLTLNPGTYVLRDDFDINTTGSCTGSGVTVYQKSGSCNVTKGTVTLSPPTSGQYQGVCIYQDRNNTNQCTLTAGNTQKITGLVYAPAATVSHCGGAPSNAPSQTIVCNKLQCTSGTNCNKTAVTPYTATKGMCQ